MIILFRKANGSPNQRVTDLFEWQPEGAKNGHWYTVSRRNILTGFMNPETSEYIRQLFNAALLGVTCRVHAKYHRDMKTLELEVMKQ